jgi:hypothetical protein
MLNKPDADGSIRSFTSSMIAQVASSLINQSLIVKSAPKTVADKKTETTKTSPEFRLEGVSTTTTPIVSVRLEKTEADSFRKGLEDCLDNDFFEPGVKSASDHYVEKWLAINPMMVQVETGKVFLASRGNDRRLAGILNLISHMAIETFHPMNELIALGALSHNSAEIKESAIRAFEYWEDIDLISNLKHHQLTPKWVDDYRLEVISDFCGDE